ncbi:hypothetical protein EVAR_55253_1 [Eumeta japonica]|uniref:Uncharacterized protein n=1 Tax=Eumeta variegata TaxID=151549 RepID=A0A4C1Z429_EUMVA|nr:hypothetical protein EVAR_55253_1 [Eumeta japonica]
MATAILPISTSCRGDLPSYIKARLQEKRRLHKLWARTRCHKLKKELNNLVREISVAIRDFRRAAWEVTIDRGDGGLKPDVQLFTGYFPETWNRGVIERKLRPFLSPRQEQYGFRSGHSTTLQLIRVLHYHYCTTGIREELRTVHSGSALGYGEGL